MKQSNVVAVIILSFAISGCGAAQLAMKGPISNQCASSGLKGCPDDRVMEFVGGDKAVAEKKLRAAAAANSPEKLRIFASALEPIGSTMGGDAGAALKSIAAILRNEQSPDAPVAKTSPAANPYGQLTDAPASNRSAHASASPLAPSLPPNIVVEELRANTERLATDPRLAPCGGILGGDSKCGRVRAFVGPLVVTNAYTSGGCPDELFLLAGRLERPHWVLLNPAGAAMNVSGQFILEDGEELFAGVRASGTAPKDDVKCAITWSGFRPASLRIDEIGRAIALGSSARKSELHDERAVVAEAHAVRRRAVPCLDDRCSRAERSAHADVIDRRTPQPAVGHAIGGREANEVGRAQAVNERCAASLGPVEVRAAEIGIEVPCRAQVNPRMRRAKSGPLGGLLRQDAVMLDPIARVPRWARVGVPWHHGPVDDDGAERRLDHPGDGPHGIARSNRARERKQRSDGDPPSAGAPVRSLLGREHVVVVAEHERVVSLGEDPDGGRGLLHPGDAPLVLCRTRGVLDVPGADAQRHPSAKCARAGRGRTRLRQVDAETRRCFPQRGLDLRRIVVERLSGRRLDDATRGRRISIGRRVRRRVLDGA